MLTNTHLLHAFTILIFLIPLNLARLLSSLAGLDPATRYDIVIVGGGTAGCVVASRLSEEQRLRVLLVEAGPDYTNDLDLEVPFFVGHLMNSRYNWNYTTVPQAGANNRSLPVSRGYILGGSSSINTMVWYRGSDSLWDRFANLSGDNEWSWDSMKQYYLRTSHLIPPQDGQDVKGKAQPSAHGTGPLKVTLPGFPFELDGLVSDVAKSLGQFNLDYNSGDTLGIGWGQFTTGGGERSSAATAYIKSVIDRANLDVLVNTRAKRLFDSFPNPGSGYIPKMTTVELVSENDRNQLMNVTASKEIVLSAGSINTPQTLLLSGIGPKEDLASLGIPLVANSPSVGENLVEHPLVFLAHAVNKETFDDVTRNSTLQMEWLEQWQYDRTGILANPPLSMFGNFKLPSSFPDPSSGPGSGNVMLLFGDGMILPPPSTGNFISVAAAVLSPTSRGSLKLSSTDPFEHPLIDFNMYSTDFDIKAQVEGIKMVEEFLSLPQFKGIVEGPYGDLANAITDEQKVEFARANVIPTFHPVGTASMDRENGVVDSRLKVKGVKGLRIVDASVFPQIPECNTQAPVYMLAEKASEIIKLDHAFNIRDEL